MIFSSQLSGPNISLPPETTRNIREVLKQEKSSSASNASSSRFRNDFGRFKQRDFIQVLKTNVAAATKPEANYLDEELEIEYLEKAISENYVEMLEFRQKLPAFKMKSEIIEMIGKHQVVLIEGNTGCGKTTQVPQYILDEALLNQKGSCTRILCTQPRRIAGKLNQRNLYFLKPVSSHFSDINSRTSGS